MFPQVKRRTACTIEERKLLKENKKNHSDENHLYTNIKGAEKKAYKRRMLKGTAKMLRFDCENKLYDAKRSLKA